MNSHKKRNPEVSTFGVFRYLFHNNEVTHENHFSIHAYAY